MTDAVVGFVRPDGRLDAAQADFVNGFLLRVVLSRFRTAGLDVSLFGRAEDYLASPDRAAVDCLVIDVRLPGLGGLDLLERIQAERAQPAVVISAHEDEQARRRAEEAGAVGFFLKPFDNRQLSAVVLEVLGRDSRKK